MRTASGGRDDEDARVGERGGGRGRADAYQGWRIVGGVGERAGVGRDSARAQSDGSGVYICACACVRMCVYTCACVRESLARAFRCVRAREKSIAPFDACNRGHQLRTGNSGGPYSG